MEECKKLYKWFMQEWAKVFILGSVFALVFWDIKMLGFFVGGAIVRSAWDRM